MSSLITRVQDAGIATRDRGLAFVDAQIPPERRSELHSSFKAWAEENPKLSTFVLIQAALCLPPLTVFTIFTLTVLTTSLTVTLVTALFVTIAFTSLCVTGALILLLPVLFAAISFGAFLFISGTITYAIVHRFNNDPRTEQLRASTKDGLRYVGTRANEISDGRFELVTTMVDKDGRDKAVNALRDDKTNLSANSIGVLDPVDKSPAGIVNGSAHTTVDSY